MAGPLEALLRPVADVLNRNIQETTPARKLAARLNGSTIAIQVSETSLAMYFSFAQDVVALTTEYGDEPDVRDQRFADLIGPYDPGRRRIGNS